MVRRLIDTDVMVDASRGRPGAAAIIDSSEDVTISIVTALELIVGARNQRDAEDIDGLIKTYYQMIRELSLEVPEY